MKSRPYRRNGKLFRYDYDNGIVECIVKAGKQVIKENAEWMEKFGKPMLDLDEQGYWTRDEAGLMAENWKNKAARDEYLDEWILEMEEEAERLAEEFILWG